jgi:hypothetical protein
VYHLELHPIRIVFGQSLTFRTRAGAGWNWLAKLKLFELFHDRPRVHPISGTFKIPTHANARPTLFHTQVTAHAVSEKLGRPKIVHSNLLNRQIMASPRVPDALIDGAARATANQKEDMTGRHFTMREEIIAYRVQGQVIGSGVDTQGKF